MAMDADDESLARKAFIEISEGWLEGWHCVHCGYRETTRMTNGCRRNAYMVIWEEEPV